MSVSRGDVVPVHSTGKRTFPVTVTGEGNCKGCEAFIVWAKTAALKAMPLDARPDSEGVYTCHFATCPAADSFREPSDEDEHE